MHPLNVCFGLMVTLLTVSLGALYLINNIDDQPLYAQLRKALTRSFVAFLVVLVAVLAQLLTMDGFGVNQAGSIEMMPYKYLHNLLDMPVVLILFLVGAVLVVAGVALTLFKAGFKRGIWFSGPGTVLVVMAIFMIAGYNGTAYYPSTADLQSSLTLHNSSSSEFTLMAMSIVSLIIPFVLAYIVYFWRKMAARSLTTQELETGDKY